VTAFHELTALDLGRLVADGEASPPELVGHFAAREDHVGAFITPTPERALDAAAALGSRPPSAGPLWGVPTAIKDLSLTAGVRTTFGSAVMRDFVPQTTDLVPTRLAEAGLISLGKTNTPEFGSPCYTEPEVAPPAVTPWDTTRMAGGSSGGAAAAVAAGLVPVAAASDGGGSIRIPASCCGLFGFKPSRGRVSGAPWYGDPVGLSTGGPMARTVRDSAAFLDVIEGRSVGDPWWAPPEAQSFLSACERDPGQLRIARFCRPLIADSVVDPEVTAAWEDTSHLLEGLGHQVVDIEVPLSPEVVGVFETAWAVLTCLHPAPPQAEPWMRPLTRWLIERGRAVSAPEFGFALAQLRQHAARALAELASYDAVLTPTLAVPPLLVGALRNDEDPAADFEGQKAFTPWTAAWNLTGMPAASLPLHHTASGLPIGMMLAGRPAEDARLYALCAQVEAARPWAERRPPAWV
jgi:amidase